MKKITPFLWFNYNAEEAAKFYVSVFKNSKILKKSGTGKTPSSINFILEGQEFIAFNGGPHFEFNHAISLYVNCKTQKEVNSLWAKLSKGGQPGQCGWIQDKFGLVWQIIPVGLGKMLTDKNAEKSERAFKAMMKMGRIEIEEIKKAYLNKT